MRPIDADELRKNVLKWMPSDPCGKAEKEFPFETDICVSMIMEIDEAPTIAPEPKWIPVTELLPEESEGLRWREELTLRFTSVWCCDVNTGTIEVRNRLQGKKTGIDGLDQYMKDTDWHWSHSWWEPTHWMPIVPLPEPPKEELE